MNAIVRPLTMTEDADTPSNMPMHDARDLTGNGAQAIIMLDGKTYFLRITRAGKLILTK